MLEWSSQSGIQVSAVATLHGGPLRARAATPTDSAALAATMASAFLDDPFVSYLVPDYETRRHRLPEMFAMLFRLGRRYGACDVTVGIESAALWRPPGTWHIPIYQYITNAPRMLAIFGRGALRAMAAMDRLERKHPREPHWYLQAIGTDPAYQGRGYGGVLLRHRLAIVDAAGLPAYLEASREANVPLYANFGFALTGEIKMPDGPTLYSMWRPARTLPRMS